MAERPALVPGPFRTTARTHARAGLAAVFRLATKSGRTRSGAQSQLRANVAQGLHRSLVPDWRFLVLLFNHEMKRNLALLERVRDAFHDHHP